MNRRLSLLVALVAIFALAGGASAASSGTKVIYSSLVGGPLPGNMPSVGAEAYAFNEFGNAVTFGGSKNGSLSNVVVTLSSWGCQSGHWTSGDCLTTPGATFSVPITFNLYAADGVTKIASATKTFEIPYRPSASAKCTGGTWYDTSPKGCFNGLGVNITFNAADFSGSVAALPASVVFGIAYNTTDYGYNPVGASACSITAAGCGYDSLNIALSTKASVGSNTTSGTVWQNSPYGSQYGDGGLAGTGVFRLDSPTSHWLYAPLIPAVQFTAVG
jgi:hypothetical protein